MRIRKEEKSPSMRESDTCRGRKRKCAEEANELIRAVIGSEMLSLSPEDSFESSSEEHKIYSSIFPREEASQSSSENTSTGDVLLLEGCNRSRGVTSNGMGGQSGHVPPRIDFSLLRDKNATPRIGSPGTTLRQEVFDAEKAEFRDIGVSKYSGTVCCTRMQKKLKAMENALDVNLLQQECGKKWSGEANLAPQSFLSVENLDTSNQNNACLETGKSVELCTNKICYYKNNGSTSLENHVVFDEFQAELEDLKGKKSLENLIQGEQSKRIGGKVQSRHMYEDKVDRHLSSVQAKKTNQRVTNPIVQSSEGCMLLSRYVLPHTQEVKVYECNIDRAKSISGHKNSSIPTSLKTGAMSGQNELENSAELNESAVTLSPETYHNDGNIITNRELDDKGEHENTLEKCRRLSLPILSEGKQTQKKVPITELRKNLRERAKVRLLAAGWKIDLKPRSGRDYQDSVYISPWGSSFWSLPKAWNALRKSLDANVTDGNASSTMQPKNKKRTHESGGNFWSELNETLKQLDTGEQNWNASTSDRVSEVNPLMSMVFTEDLSLLKKRKKCRYKEDEENTDVDNKDEHNKHFRKAHRNGYSFLPLDSTQPVKTRGVKLDEFSGLDLERVVRKEKDIHGRALFSGKQKSVNGNSERVVRTEKDIHGRVLFSGKQKSVNGKLSHAGDLYTNRKLSHLDRVRSMHWKLLDGGEERNMHCKVLHVGDLVSINGNGEDNIERRNIDGQLLHAGNQSSMDGRLSDVQKKQNIHEKVLDVDDQCSMCEKMFQKNIHEKVLDVDDQCNMCEKMFCATDGGIHKQILITKRERDLYPWLPQSGKILNASGQRSIHHVSKQSGMHGKLLIGREQRSTGEITDLSCMHGKHSDGNEQRTVHGSNNQDGTHGKFSYEREQWRVHGISNQSGMSGKCLETREQRSVHAKACHLAGQRCIHEMLLSAANKRNICGEISDAGGQRSTHEECLHAGKKMCTEEKVSSAGEQQSTQKMLHGGNASKYKKISKTGERNFMDNQLCAGNMKNMHEKLSDSGKQKFTHDKLLHGDEERDIHNKLSHTSNQRSIYEKVFFDGDSKEELLSQGKINRKFIQKLICGESQYYELCNKSISKGLQIIQKEISENGVAQLASTQNLNGDTEDLPALDTIADLEISDVVNGFQKTEGINTSVLIRSRTGIKPNGQVEQLGGNMDDTEKRRNLNESEAGQKQEEELVCLLESNCNERLGREPEYECSQNANKPREDKKVSKFSKTHRGQMSRNIIERELSRQLSELELDKNSNKLEEDGAGRKLTLSLVGQKINESEMGRQFDGQQSGRLKSFRFILDPQVDMATNDYNDSTAAKESNWDQAGRTGKISYVSQAGRKSDLAYPRASKSGRKSNESQASKLGRKLKKPQAGRQYNKPQAGKRLKSFTESSEFRIENEPKMKTCIIIDDDNITLASILKNRKCSSCFTKGSGDLYAKSKLDAGKTFFYRAEKNKNHKGGCVLSVRRSSKRDTHSKCDRDFSSTSKRTILSWLIDAGIVFEGESVQYLNKKSNRIMKYGRITRDGIHCKCCNRVLTISNFATHAGSKINRPFSSIFVQSGKSLAICQIEAWSAEYKCRKGGMRFIEVDENDQNDDACGFCGDGGDLLCCDKCPSTFHQDCLTLKDVPEGNWYCPNCTCAICGTLGHDEQEVHISNLIICDQCGLKYHKKCLHERAIQVEELKAMDSVFCGQNCKKVSEGLHQLLGISNPIEEGLTWSLLRSINEDRRFCSPQRLALMAECNTKLSIALSVMEECFERMVDPRTGIDMIPQVVYSWGSNFSRLNYQGFYTVVLEREDELISVASIRIHGAHFAEMPLIATCEPYRRQGMCRRLVNTIEKMLRSLNVEKLILSAVSDLLEYWTTVFGFKPLDDSQKEEIKNLNMMTFPGTMLLQKSICRPDSQNGVQTGKQVDHALCGEGNILAPQAQGDDIQYVQLKLTDTESALSVPSDIRDVSTWIQTPHSKMLAEVEEWKCENDLDNTLITDKERTINCHVVGIVDAQAQEKGCTESSFCVPGGINAVNTEVETTPSKIVIDAKLRWKDCGGLDNALTVVEERSTFQSNNSASDAQVQGGSSEVSMLKKTRIESVDVLGDAAVISTTVDGRILSREMEMKKCKRGLERTFEEEDDLPSSCLKGEELNTQTHGGNTLMREEERSTVRSNNSLLAAQIQINIAKVSVLCKTDSESVRLDTLGDYNTIVDTAVLPKEEVWTCKKDTDKTFEAEEERTSSCLKSEELDTQAHGDSAEIHVPHNGQMDSVLCVSRDMAEVHMLKMTRTSGMSPKAEVEWEHDKDSESMMAIEEEKSTMSSMETAMKDPTNMVLEGRVFSEEASVDMFVKEILDSCLDRLHLKQCINDTATVEDSTSDVDSRNIGFLLG